MKILITGGLGFIGVNTSLDFFKNSHEIFIIDNLSRKGNIENYLMLKEKINFTFWNKDIRNFFDLESIFKKNTFDAIIHLAGQVAVTSSVRNPREDFEINALGTFNLLECTRLYSPESVFIFSSTNKVYGEYKSDLVESDVRYYYEPKLGWSPCINEFQNLDFHSPYGCSKGAADQYVRDYSRIYGLKTVVLRQSCIYGQNQFGIEDQGWVSWLSIAANFDKPFVIYGNGKQVRDVLHIDDLSNLYKMIITNINICKGEVYNIGGGPFNTLSLLELIQLIEKKLNKKVKYTFSEWRPGDQKIYVSDISKVKNDIGWEPKISAEDGVFSLIDWINKNENTFKNLNLI